jgi:pyruvate formate lyase activating enzyme
MTGRDAALLALVAVGLILMLMASVSHVGAQRSVVGPVAPEKPLGPPLTLQQARDAGLSLREAAYYEKLKDGLVRCRLCPHECILAHGQRGPCKVRVNFDGTLRTLVYGRPVALSALDAIEKKPLFHVLPGTRAFSISTMGCNLGCIFCQNWETSQLSPEEGNHRLWIDIARREFPGLIASAEEVAPAEIVALAKETGCQSIAYTYTEASVYYEYMLETARLAKKEGIKNLWVTCGYLNPKPLRELCRYIDAANVDLKGFTEEFYQTYCGASVAPVLRTLKTLHEEGVWFEITNLVIPRANDDPKMVRNMCKWIVKELGPDYPLHFSRFFPKYKLLDRPPTPLSTLKRCAEIAREEGIRFVYIGNVYGKHDMEDTICPECGRVIIRRDRYVIKEYRIRDGKCAFCGAAIPGIFPK